MLVACQVDIHYMKYDFVPSKLIYEPAHNKTYNKTCATSKDSDQTAHLCSLIWVLADCMCATSKDSDQTACLCSLIWVLADCMCLLQPLGYPKRDEQEPLPYWVDVQADLSLCWSHTSYCRFCRVLVQISFICAIYGCLMQLKMWK